MAEPAPALRLDNRGRISTVADCLARGRTMGLTRLDAQLLLAHALGCSRTWLLAHDDAAVANERRVIDLLARRAAGEPLAYLVGEREFYGLALEVTPDVLIPRPDTEILVDWAAELLLANVPSRVRLNVQPLVADLGTGSGAIALALKQAVPAAEVHACDASPAALAVARRNGKRLGLEVRWCLGSWWQAFAKGAAFDLAVANPPYLAADDPHLADLRHEPRTALVPQRDDGHGLAALATVIDGACAHLSAGAWLLLEHGSEQAAAVQAKLRAAGFEAVQTRADLAGQPRATGGRWARGLKLGA